MSEKLEDIEIVDSNPAPIVGISLVGHKTFEI